MTEAEAVSEQVSRLLDEYDDAGDDITRDRVALQLGDVGFRTVEEARTNLPLIRAAECRRARETDETP